MIATFARGAAQASTETHAAALEPAPAERTCDACGYLVIEFRPLDRCPMCGMVAAELVPAAVVVAASAA